MGQFDNDFTPYWDQNGLLAPNPVPSGITQGSDNGPMFTSEYYIMRAKNGLDTEPPGSLTWWYRVNRCMIGGTGVLKRAPLDESPEGPDDYYGVMSASKVLDIPQLAQRIYKHGLKHWGSFDTTGENHWTFENFLWRQPQLLYATICAANVASRWKFWQWPLAAYSALCILVSCIGVPTSSADPRRLCWHLIQATVKDSFLCRLVSKVWFKRLYRDYGATGMKAVAAVYYQPQGFGNPYARWWVD